MRAFQKDNVIRLLAITYNVERDKEFRSLRNAIASSYVPFASTCRGRSRRLMRKRGAGPGVVQREARSQCLEQEYTTHSAGSLVLRSGTRSL